MGVPWTEEDRPKEEKAEAEDSDWELMRRRARTQIRTERERTSCRPNQKCCRIDGDDDDGGGSLFFIVIFTVTAREEERTEEEEQRRRYNAI